MTLPGVEALINNQFRVIKRNNIQLELVKWRCFDDVQLVLILRDSIANWVKLFRIEAGNLFLLAFCSLTRKLLRQVTRCSFTLKLPQLYSSLLSRAY